MSPWSKNVVAMWIFKCGAKRESVKIQHQTATPELEVGRNPKALSGGAH